MGLEETKDGEGPGFPAKVVPTFHGEVHAKFYQFKLDLITNASLKCRVRPRLISLSHGNIDSVTRTIEKNLPNSFF